MRLPRTLHTLLVLVLVTWMPWCLCRWVPQGCSVSRVGGESVASTDDVPSCCRQHGCDQGGDDGQINDSPGDGTTEREEGPCSGCASPCCAPKLHLAAAMPDVPCDTIGVDLPPSLFVDAMVFVQANGADSTESHPWTGPPPGLGLGHGSGRLHLLQASILLT